MPHHPEPSTLPTPFSARDSLTAPLQAPATVTAGSPFSVPLGTLALLFMVGSVVVAVLLGFAIAAWFQPVTPWATGLAAGVGVLFTALPLGAVLLGLARGGAKPRPADSVAAAGRALGAAAAPSAGTGTQGLAQGIAQGPAQGLAQGPNGPNGLAHGLAHGLDGLAQGLAIGREPFMDMVAREWSRARRYGTGAALLLVEIDRYPRLTDALGDPAGEKVLADLLTATAHTLRGADALTRYEAGQMAVFLAHADATGALDVAERIRERAEQMEVAVPPRRVRFTVSVGVAQLRPAHLYLQALIEDVADALAAARAAGGNCVRAAPVDIGQRPAPGAARDGSRAGKK